MLAQKVRAVFKRCLRSNKLRPYSPLPYTPDEAKKHIRSLFITGMVYEDTNTWCIHHIKPITMFTGSELEIIIRANSLDNITVLTHAEHNKLHSILRNKLEPITHERALEIIIKEREDNI